jgi:hypothetical protein
MVIPGAKHLGRGTAALIWGSMVLVVAAFVAYLLLIRGQGDTPPDSVAVVPFVSGYLVFMAVLLWLATLDQPRLATLRPAMLAAAGAGLLLLGIFAMFSIGLPIFLAGVLASIAAVRVLVGMNSRKALVSEIAAAVIAVTVLVGGFGVSSRIIVCPPTGTMGGGGSGFLTPAYHYQCVNGKLTWYPGDCNNGFQGFDANGNPILSTGC